MSGGNCPAVNTEFGYSWGGKKLTVTYVGGRGGGGTLGGSNGGTQRGSIQDKDFSKNQNGVGGGGVGRFVVGRKYEKSMFLGESLGRSEEAEAKMWGVGGLGGNYDGTERK